MHIPDGFLDIKTVVITNIISSIFLFFAIRKVTKFLTPERIPLMGICSAFVFTIQLIAVPVFSGTSVHLTGSVLISVLLGPFSGLVVISSALIMQALLFQHGGIVSVGANIFNIGIVGCIVGYLVYKLFPTNLFSAVSCWIVTVLGAFFCVLELYFSNKVDLKPGLVAMLSTHMIIGIIEAIATYLILLVIDKVRPDLRSLTKV